MIKYVILGFLMNYSLTGYDIKRFMNKSTSNFANASFGSIYPALDKLEKQGCISSSTVVESGKYKKQYSITEMGRKEFLQWLEEPIDFMKSYEDILAKIFFYENLPKEKVIENVTQLIDKIKFKIESLKRLKSEIDGVAGFFEASTLYFGIDHLNFMADWYTDFLNKFIGGELK